MRELQTLDNELDLNEETIKEIFTLLHPDENDLISNIEVEKLINTIIPLYSEKKNNERGSIFYDKTQLRFTYSPLPVLAQGSSKQEKHKIASEVLNNLSLEKLSELKFIYLSSDRNNRKLVDYKKILASFYIVFKETNKLKYYKAAEDLKQQLSISLQEVEAVFIAIKEDDSSLISYELLSELICKLEKVFFMI